MRGHRTPRQFRLRAAPCPGQRWDGNRRSDYPMAGGSAFTFTLPLAAASGTQPDAPSSDGPPPEPDSSPRFRVV